MLLALVLESGAKPAERLSKRINIEVSDTTLLRLVCQEKVPDRPIPVTALGVDDWAYKKRDWYGTILVNLESNRIIDLLPDREAITLEKWLKNNPGIEVISRDRYVKYLQGAGKGDLMQCR